MVMKVYTIILALMFSLCVSYSQEYETYENEMGYYYVERFPIFMYEDLQKDLSYMLDYIQKSTIYPISAINDTIEGCVDIKFVVDTCGCVNYAKVVRGVRKDLDDEALRVIRNLKFKSPAKHHGKKVRFPFTIPVYFELSNDKHKP